MAKKQKDPSSEPGKVATKKSAPIKFTCNFTCGTDRVNKGETATAEQIKYLESLGLDMSKYVK